MARPLRPLVTHEEPPEIFDLPAAVLCAHCGQPDCPGCAVAEDEGSGLIAIVPWERPGATWTRLWATGRATTLNAETFFAALPDGPLRPAATFALIAELCAVSSMALLILPVAAIVLPAVAAEIASNPAFRSLVLRWIFLSIPALAVWMVLAHAVHAVALDVGARKQGARSQRRRALRFGLYACGWDLMSGPFGAIAAGVSEGRRGVGAALSASMRVPGRATIALLQGLYGLSPAAMARARRWGGAAAVVLTIVSALAIFVVAILA